MQLKNGNQNWNVHFKMAICLKNVTTKTTSPPPISPELICDRKSRRLLHFSWWLALSTSIQDSNGTEFQGYQGTHIQEQQIPGYLHQLPYCLEIQAGNITIRNTSVMGKKKKMVPELHGLVIHIQTMEIVLKCWSFMLFPFPCSPSQALEILLS